VPPAAEVARQEGGGIRRWLVPLLILIVLVLVLLYLLMQCGAPPA
jgi:hypothetical protein